MLTRRMFSALALVALSYPIGNAMAQSGAYPTRPIRIVVTLPPGGSNDFIARLIAEGLQPVLGQPVIVENKPGGSGIIATDYVAKQPADGYTLLATPNTHITNPYFFAKLPYDVIKDFDPISMMIVVPFVLTVHASIPVMSIKEFLVYTRANPGKLSCGSAGIGGSPRLAVEMLKSMAGIDFLYVPYKGAAGVVSALLSGEIEFTIGAINSLLPHLRSGKLRAIAVSGGTRTPLLPDVSAIAEAVPGYEMNSWTGMLAPAGTPRAILDRLSTEINRIVQDPQIVKARLTPVGIEPIGTTPERFMEIMKSDLAMYGRFAKDAKIKRE